MGFSSWFSRLSLGVKVQDLVRGFLTGAGERVRGSLTVAPEGGGSSGRSLLTDWRSRL